MPTEAKHPEVSPQDPTAVSSLPDNNRDHKEYESSELSDLGEDQSEAETDKMDFLDEENSNSENVSDLNALSKLTEMARLKEIDSEDDLDDSMLTSSVESKRPLLNGDGESRSKRVKLTRNEDELDDAQEADGEDEGEADEEENGNGKEPDAELVLESAENEANTMDGTIMDGKVSEEKDKEEEPELKEREQKEDEAESEAESELSEDNEDVDLNEQRILAVTDLVTIEKSFAEIRDKLYHDKLKFLEHELQLCLDGSHPELAKIYYKINGFYQDSLRLANNTLNYRLKCIDNETIATRTSIHQDFLKKMIDGKNEMISDTTSKWYKINKERNQMDQIVPDHGYSAIPDINSLINPPIHDEPMMNGVSNLTHLSNGNDYNSHIAINGFGANGNYPEPITLTKKELKQNRLIELVQQRNDFNQEVGILNGLIHFHGFPSAVDLSSDDRTKALNHELLLRKASEEEVAEDLRAMGII